ncbi:hypothetical protein ACOSP7_021630 [Xanthoceras sorbifolium]
MLLDSGVRRRFDGSFDFKHKERQDVGREREQRYQGGKATSSGVTKKTAAPGWRRNQQHRGCDSKRLVTMLSKGPAVTVRDQQRQ